MLPDELAKKAAGEEAARRIENHQRIGLGTGSTVRYFLEALGRRVAEGELRDVAGFPTSHRTEERAKALGIALTTLDAEPTLDVAVDGADQVDPEWRLIKGLGGAHLREKIVACASRKLVVIVDERKLVSTLGQGCPLPVEVLPFGWQATAAELRGLGGEPQLRRDANQSLVTTDQGNWILDVDFGALEDPQGLAQKLDAIPGVLGHGLFLDMVDDVIVGTSRGTVLPVRGR